MAHELRPGSSESEHERVACVLLVDDDQLDLSTLRMLLEISGGFRVLEFADPLQAILELERTLVDIVISDYMMPGINGIDLLKKARALQPQAMRILLTGHADKLNATRAFTEAGVYQYMEKPWDNECLLLVLRNALQEKDLRQQQPAEFLARGAARQNSS
jgi:adenylate cyclase